VLCEQEPEDDLESPGSIPGESAEGEGSGVCGEDKEGFRATELHADEQDAQCPGADREHPPAACETDRKGQGECESGVRLEDQLEPCGRVFVSGPSLLGTI